MLTAVFPFLLALARSVPALEQLFRAIVAERDKDRAREAAQRLQAKNAAVDAAIDRADNGPGLGVTHAEQAKPFVDQGEPGPGA